MAYAMWLLAPVCLTLISLGYSAWFAAGHKAARAANKAVAQANELAVIRQQREMTEIMGQHL